MYVNENNIILHIIISMIMVLVTAEDCSRNRLYSSVFLRCVVSDTRQEAHTLIAQVWLPSIHPSALAPWSLRFDI